VADTERWRLILLWRIHHIETPPTEERHAIQVVNPAFAFWQNLLNREKQIRKAYPMAVMIEVRNPSSPDSSWFNPGLRRGQHGVAKIAMNRLVYDVKPKCPHCGHPIPMEEFGQ
jgi:hypothetical protein